MTTEEVQKLYTEKGSFYHFLFVKLLGIGGRTKDFLRRAGYAQPNFKILDAGCGTGNATRALWGIAKERGCENVTLHAFDITQKMLDLFKSWIDKMGASNISLRQADVLKLDQLPSDWTGYDRIVSSGMLEYVSKDEIRQALTGLRKLLKPDGKLALFITKRNLLTKLLVGWWWKANTYSREELQKIFTDAGFSAFTITRSHWYSMFTIEAIK